MTLGGQILRGVPLRIGASGNNVTILRTLAIDFGSKRIGLAMSDEGARFATPVEVLQVTSDQQAKESILSMIRKEGVKRLVIGLPLNMDGSTGPAAKNAIEWGRSLAKLAGLELIFVDERLSSFDAEQSLIARKRAGEKITRKGRKQQLDALAAAGFLQAFLDGNLSPIQV